MRAAPVAHTPRKPLPSVDSLRCFLSAAVHLNFRRASSEVGLTPTAFGERIRSLEEDLGCALFARTTRWVELTAEGRALLPAVERALAVVEACLDAVRAPADAPVRLRIGTRFELGQSWLSPSCLALEHARPNWQIDLYCGSGPDILERLERGLLDAAVTSAPTASAAWQVEVLHEETYEFVASPRLLKGRPFDRSAHASQHTLLDVDEHLPLARYLMSAAPNLRFAQVRVFGAGALVRECALAGLGVAVLPTYMIEPDLAARRLRRILPRAKLLSDSFRLLFRKSSRLSSVLTQLADHLRRCPLR